MSWSWGSSDTQGHGRPVLGTISRNIISIYNNIQFWLLGSRMRRWAVQIPLQKAEESGLCSAEERHDSVVWMTEGRGNHSNAFVLSVRTSKQFKRPSREILPQFYYQRSLLGCWVFELNDCIPLILPLPPVRSYWPFLVLWIKLGKKWTELVISKAGYTQQISAVIWSKRSGVAGQTGLHFGNHVTMISEGSQGPGMPHHVLFRILFDCLEHLKYFVIYVPKILDGQLKMCQNWQYFQTFLWHFGMK